MLELLRLLAHTLFDLELSRQLLLGLHLEILDEEDVLVFFSPFSLLLHIDDRHILIDQACLLTVGGSLVLLVDLVELS